MTNNTKVSFRSLDWTKTSHPEWAYQHPVMREALRSMREALQAREDRIMREIEADKLKTPEQREAERAEYIRQFQEWERQQQADLERWYGY